MTYIIFIIYENNLFTTVNNFLNTVDNDFFTTVRPYDITDQCSHTGFCI